MNAKKAKALRKLAKAVKPNVIEYTNSNGTRWHSIETYKGFYRESKRGMK